MEEGRYYISNGRLVFEHEDGEVQEGPAMFELRAVFNHLGILYPDGWVTDGEDLFPYKAGDPRCEAALKTQEQLLLEETARWEATLSPRQLLLDLPHQYLEDLQPLELSEVSKRATAAMEELNEVLSHLLKEYPRGL